MFAGRLTLRGIRKEASNAHTFVFDKPRTAWLAGQHFMFIKPHFPFDLRGVTRVFTISSAPEEETLCFTTRYFDDQSSSFKRALFRMQPGERLWAYGPSPIFDYFRALDTRRHYVFLTGGIGITPVRATLQHHAAVSGSLTATLLYANRDHEVIFKEEIDSFQIAMNSFAVRYITSPQHIDAALIAEASRQYSSPVFIISGSRVFVAGMVTILRNAGVQKSNIIADKFRAIPLSGGGSEASVCFSEITTGRQHTAKIIACVKRESPRFSYLRVFGIPGCVLIYVDVLKMFLPGFFER